MKRKTMNIISISLIGIVTIICCFILFITNGIIRKILLITGIVLLILSCIFEKKANNPKVEKYGILRAIIKKSNHIED